jgi:SAM-dependent methyltransferase
VTANRLRGAVRRRASRLPWRAARDKRALLADRSLTVAERRMLGRVSLRVSARDAMYGSGGSHYWRVGLSALRCIEEALAHAGSPPINRLLDLPCGHGRVLRWLAARFPDARLTACDLDRDGVDFCALRLGALPAYSVEDVGSLRLVGRFDLIWCGSLVTHLDGERIGALLEAFHRHLSHGGVLVLTSHGERAARRMRSAEMDYLLDDERLAHVLRDYERNGFGYADYPRADGYGVSIASPDWLRGTVTAVGGMREVWFRAAGWDDHQDVFAFSAA